MLWGGSEQSDLFARIDHWKQEVVKGTLQQASATQPRPQQHEPHQMKLRSRVTRSALAQVSGNPCSRKRKASGVMADAPARKYGKKAVTDERIEDTARRPGRGRPPKNPQTVFHEDGPVEQTASRRQGRSANYAEFSKSREPSLPTRTEFPPSIWSPSGSTSPRKPSTSPSKKRQITLDKPISEAAIDMDYLSRCAPAVHLTTFRELKIDGVDILSPVDHLFQDLQGVPQGLIPFALKVYPSQCIPNMVWILLTL